jgi:hypothetical protein
MKKFTLSLALLACLFVTVNAAAETVIKTVVKKVCFEEFATSIGTNWSWNGTTGRNLSGMFPNNFLDSTGNSINLPAYGFSLPEYSYQSKGAEFYWGGWNGQIMNFWCGTGLSTVTNTTYNGFLNEMASVTGSGNNNSQTYAVAYGDCFNDLPYEDSEAIRISLPSGARVKSIAITNTVYTATSLSTGLSDTGNSVEAPAITKAGDAFGINIYGLDTNGDLIEWLDENGNPKDSIQVPLGKWCNNAPQILMNWQTVCLSNIENAAELRFSFYTTIDGDDSEWGFFTPAYFAFDDLKYEIDEEVEVEVEEEIDEE